MIRIKNNQRFKIMKDYNNNKINKDYIQTQNDTLLLYLDKKHLYDISDKNDYTDKMYLNTSYPIHTVTYKNKIPIVYTQPKEDFIPYYCLYPNVKHIYNVPKLLSLLQECIDITKIFIKKNKGISEKLFKFDLLEYIERCDINEPVTSEEIPEIVDEVIEYEPLDTDVSDNSDEESDEENYNYYNTFED